MNEMRRNVTVGLFVLVALTCLAFLIVLFGQQPEWMVQTNERLLTIRFDRATGIRPGTYVTVNGYEIGRVQSIRLADRERLRSGVIVKAALDPGIVLREGSYARTTEPGLGMGRPPIEIVPGPPDAQPLKPDAVISGEMTSVVESLIPPQIISTLDKTGTQLGEAASALKPVLEDLHEVLQARSPAEVDRPGGPTGNIASAAARLDTTLRSLNSLIGEESTQNKLREAIDNFAQISSDGRTAAANLKTASEKVSVLTDDAGQFLKQGRDTLTRLDDSTTRVARAAIDALDGASGLISGLQQIVLKASQGEGTVGKFLNDNRLYEAAVLSFQRLAETINEFKVVVLEWQKGRIKVAF